MSPLLFLLSELAGPGWWNAQASLGPLRPKSTTDEALGVDPSKTQTQLKHRQMD